MVSHDVSWYVSLGFGASEDEGLESHFLLLACYIIVYVLQYCSLL